MRRIKNGKRWFLAVPTVLIMGPLLVAPLFFNFVSSFDVQTVGVETAGEWTLANYTKIFSDSFFLGAFVRTIGIGLATVIVCIGIGFPYAYFVSRRIPWRELQMAALIAPLLVNMVVRVYGWQVLLSPSGVINSFLLDLGILQRPLSLLFNEFAVVVSLVHVLLPYMVLSIYTALRAIPSDLDEAARSLGAGSIRAFFAVTVPLARPGVAAGSILVFTLSAGSFLVPAVMGGGRVSTLPTLVYGYSQVLNWPLASALALLLMALTVPPIVMFQRASLRTVPAART